MRTLIDTMNVGSTRQTECVLYVFMCTGMVPFRIGEMLAHISMRRNVYVI